MSQLLIQHYLNELQMLRRVGGTAREGSVIHFGVATPAKKSIRR